MKIVAWIVVIFLLAGGFFYLAGEGIDDQRRMRDALRITGNAAGMSEGDIHALGDRLANDGAGTIGDARDVLFLVVCSGYFPRPTVESAARAALGLMRVYGKSARQAVTELVPLSRERLGDPFVACPK